MAFLPEFLNDNAHRAYPFDKSVNDNGVPPALILDLGIIATESLPDNSDINDNNNVIYISKIVTDGEHIRFYMSAKIGGTTVDFGCVATADITTPAYSRIDLAPVINNAYNIVFEGFIVLGDLSLLSKLPPVTTLTAAKGRIYTGCIQHMTQWVAGINIDGQILSGIVTLQPGPGVTFDVDEVTNTIKIGCAGAIPPSNAIIVTDADILAELTRLYGTPISKINTVAVTNGDWTISTVDGDGLSVSVNNDANSITINNDFAKACCSKTDIEYIVNNISALNERIGVVQSFQSQLETNLNILSAQMTKLG